MPDGFDEQMGMGRDLRTLASNLSNSAILGQAINRVNEIVRTASRGQTRFVLWADMVRVLIFCWGRRNLVRG